MKRDLTFVAGLEKEIAKKYGTEAIQNPKGNWTEESEEEYEVQAKKVFEREFSHQEDNEKELVNGIYVSKKLIKKNNIVCGVCRKYHLSLRDEVYVQKFECCHACYVKHVEGREQRWKDGWRPNKEDE
tara:strand:- start:6093 stop:6476 length:384 start_codon:yes stop_codon:yes gene_type:complete